MLKASAESNELLKSDKRYGGRLTATSCSGKESNNLNGKEWKMHEEKKSENGLPMKMKNERNGNRHLQHDQLLYLLA